MFENVFNVYNNLDMSDDCGTRRTPMGAKAALKIEFLFL